MSTLSSFTGGGISNLVEDTTPQLGGDLDLNGEVLRDANIYFGADVGGIPHSYFDSNGRLEIGGDFVVNGGDITLNGTGRIQGIDTVSANTDAANKLYVDNAGYILGFAIVNMGSSTIYSSFNVASISFSSGDFQIYWDVDPPDEDYGIAVSHLQSNGNEYQTGVQIRPQDYPSTYTGSTKINAYLNGSSTNIGWVSVLMYHVGS